MAPSDRVIIAISAFFSVTVDLNLFEDVLMVNAQLCESTTPDNEFVPIEGALVQLDFEGLVSLGDVNSGITHRLDHDVVTGTRLLLVLFVTTDSTCHRCCYVSAAVSIKMYKLFS